MAASPFAFFRATNRLFWADAARRPELARFAVTTWIHGDLHLDNLGVRDEDDGTIGYGLVDFDETLIADYQLDLWRLMASLIVVGRSAGRSNAMLRDAVDAFTDSYVETLAAPDVAVRRFTAASTAGPIGRLLTQAAARVPSVLTSWTHGGRLAADDLMPVSAATENELRTAFASYTAARWPNRTRVPVLTVKSVAARLHAGMGSLGVQRYYVLVEGEGTTAADVILDVKEQRAPAGAAYTRASTGARNEGERAVLGSRALDQNTERYLGWLLLDGRPFLVRALTRHRDSLELDEHWEELRAIAATWGAVVAVAHARGRRDFAAVVSARIATDRSAFRELVWTQAARTAEQNLLDYTAFRRRGEP